MEALRDADISDAMDASKADGPSARAGTDRTKVRALGPLEKFAIASELGHLGPCKVRIKPHVETRMTRISGLTHQIYPSYSYD